MTCRATGITRAPSQPPPLRTVCGLHLTPRACVGCHKSGARVGRADASGDRKNPGPVVHVSSRSLGDYLLQIQPSPRAPYLNTTSPTSLPFLPDLWQRQANAPARCASFLPLNSCLSAGNTARLPNPASLDHATRCFLCVLALVGLLPPCAAPSARSPTGTSARSCCARNSSKTLPRAPSVTSCVHSYAPECIIALLLQQ